MILPSLLLLLSTQWNGAAYAQESGAPPCLDDKAILHEAQIAFPSRYEALVRLRDSDPDRFARLLHNTTHVLDDPSMVAAVERLAAAEARLDEVSRALARAGASERARLEGALVGAAEAVVDARIGVKEVKLAALNDELELLGRELQAMERGRDAAVGELVDRAAR